MASIGRDVEAPRRVVVTGANGFLGCYVTRELVSQGYEVIGMARSEAALRATNPAEVKPLITTLEQVGNVDLGALGFGALGFGVRESGADAIIHCAGLSSPWGKQSEFEDANVAGTRNVVRFAQRNNISRVVFVSSPSVYSAQRDRLNIREDEFDRNNNLNHYIASKLRAEELLHAAHRAGDLPELVIIRPRGLIGVGDTSVIPRLLRVNDRLGVPLFNDGQHLVDLTSVENVALALRLAVETTYADGRTFNITNGDPRPFKDLLDLLMAEIGRTGRYWKANARVLYRLAGAFEAVCARLPRQPEPPITRYTLSTIAHSQTLDISAACELLGYEPRVTLEESIRAFARGAAGGGERAAGIDRAGASRAAATSGVSCTDQAAGTDHADSAAGTEPAVNPDHAGSAAGTHRLRYFACGHTHHKTSQMFAGGTPERRVFPSGVFLYDHPAGHRVLFDTGYAPPSRHRRAKAGPLTLKDAGLAGWIYGRLLPPVVSTRETIDQQLVHAGIDPATITHVVLSHGHPDHIGGVQFFPQAQFVVSGGLAQKLRGPRLKDGIFRQLLPDWFEERLLILDDSALSSTTASSSVAPQVSDRDFALTGYDLFGDGTYLVTSLPGHAQGHVGALVEEKVLLAGDAAWGSDLAGCCADMKPVPRFIQDDAEQYVRTAQKLDDLAKHITVVYSHDQHDVRDQSSAHDQHSANDQHGAGQVGWL